MTSVLNHHRIETPEGIDFSVNVAGVGSRFCATAIDVMALAAALLLVLFGLGFFSAVLTDALGIAVWTVTSFAVIWGYHVVFESDFRGRTLGHMAVGLRVTRLDGGRIDFVAAAIRGLFWPIEVFGLPVLAVASAFASPSNQRLGDLAAGTLVIYDERPILTRRARLQPAAYAPNAPFLRWDVSRVSPRDTAVIRSFIERRTQIAFGARVHLAEQLAARIQPLVTGAPTNWHPESFLEGVVAAKARRD
ncbi:MAG: RDD family protein [Acidimicrobiia bacterium]